MKEHFEGADGKRSLVGALQEQRLVQGDADVAQALADHGEVIEISSGTTFIHQGAHDDTVFLILSGEAQVFVNHRPKARRAAREQVGEMAAIDPTVPRSATVTAITDILALKISSKKFADALDKKPRLWKPLAKMLADRIREYEKFFRPANKNPVLFLGSSVESLPVARLAMADFKHDSNIEVKLWSKGVFGPSGVGIDDLLHEVNAADFALFVIGPDDKITSRDQEYMATRDNVIFELGLFMGRLGRERVFMLMRHGALLHIPSDLTGVTPATYTVKAGPITGNDLVAPCEELRQAMRKLGAV